MEPVLMKLANIALSLPKTNNAHFSEIDLNAHSLQKTLLHLWSKLMLNAN